MGEGAEEENAAVAGPGKVYMVAREDKIGHLR